MLHSWLISSLCLYLMFVGYLSADWPQSTPSAVQLLGLFADGTDADAPAIWSVHSRAMFTAAILLSHQYNITVDGQLIGWQSVDTGADAINASRSSCLAVSTSNIVGIVGPGFSREAQVIAPFAQTIGLPVISYGATDPELSDRSTYPTFYRTIPSDNAAALAIAALFVEYNWTSCVLIYQNDAFGSGGAKAIAEVFNNNSLIITQAVIFDLALLTIRGDLKSLLTSSSTRIVVVWADSAHTKLILKNALDGDVLGPQFTWIMRANISLNNFNQSSYDQLTGILSIQAVVGNVVNAPINITLLNAAYDIWRQYEPASFPGSDNVDYYALFAFDATWTLIQALHRFCSARTDTSPSCISFVNTSFCFDRQLLNSNSLFEIINDNTFLGVSGFVQYSSAATDRINGSYYVLKNVQRFLYGLSYVSVLIWSDSYGWDLHSQRQTNVIVWPGNSLDSPNGYAAISRMTLRIAVVESPPFTIVSQVLDDNEQITQKLVGYIPDLIELLRTQMGFTANIILLPANYSYSTLVDEVAGGIYDLVVTDMTITAARREEVGFSTSIFDNSLRIIMRESSRTNVDLLRYLRPFSLKLWLILLCTTIYAGLLVCLLERHRNEALHDRSISSMIGMSMWYSMGTILGFGADFTVETAAGRLLTVGLYILSLISVAAYTANLASDLTISKSEDIISGIDDIKNGRIPFNRIGIKTNTAVEDYYLREISDGVRNYFPLEVYQDIFDDLLNNKIDTAIFDSGLLEYSVNNIYCNLTLVGTDFARSSLGIIFQKNWQYAEELDIILLSLRESGALDDIKVKWFQTSRCAGMSDGLPSMSIEAMAGLFLTVGVISILALLFFLWKKISMIMNDLLMGMRSMGLIYGERLLSIKLSQRSPTGR